MPYGGGVEVGIVTGVHTCKSGAVWVRYPSHPKLYAVDGLLISRTAEAAEAHLQKMRKGKSPTTNTPPMKPANPRLIPKKTLNLAKIPPLTHLIPKTQLKVPRHYGTRKRAPERCNT